MTTAPTSQQSSTAPPLMLSVSGCRGVVGESFTPETICRFVGAFVSWLRQQPEHLEQQSLRIVVSRDGREGGKVLLWLASAALRASGCDVISLDVATTPTTGLMVTRHNAAGGLVLTASHNPGQWNGIKPITHQGMAASLEQATRIIELYHADTPSWVPHDVHGTLHSDDTAAHAHVAVVLQAISKVVPLARIQDRGYKVVLDSVNASGARPGAMLLEALGCNLIHIHNEATGIFPHTPEPTRENLQGLCEHVKKHRADVGFAQDPDADRLAIIDNKAQYIGEEFTLVLASKALLDTSSTPANACLATNLSTSRMIEDIASAHGSRVIRTPVGEANVAAGMLANNCPLAGEGNGGVIWPAVVGIRDSLSAMALTLALLTHHNTTLDAIVKTITPYHILKRKLPLRDNLAQAAIAALADHYANERLDTQDGLRIDLDSQSAWLHARASNTEPIFRLIAEAPEPSIAQAILDHAQTLIDSL
jgi:phosphomannomutase